jgi:hypothetical protein
MIDQPNAAHRRTWVALVGLLALFSGAGASAQTPASDEDAINPDRPGIADGSAVVGRGRIQLEAGFQHERREDGGDTERAQFLPALLRVGLGSRWEARIEGNTFIRLSASDVGSNSTSGFAPISFGFKAHLLESAGPRQPSVGAIVRVFPRSGTGSFHAGQVTGDARLAADWDLTPSLSLNPNVGLGFYEGDDGETLTAGLFAVTLTYSNGRKTINPFVDLALQAPEASAGGSALIVDAGVAYLPTRDIQLDVSIGAGAHGRTPPHPFVAVGVSLRFHASR